MEVKIFFFIKKNISLKGQEKGAAKGDLESIIINLSHESKTEGNSEAAIWHWVCLIG